MREGIVWLHCGWFKFWVWRGGEFAVGILASGVSGWGGGVGVGGSQGGSVAVCVFLGTWDL